MKRISLIVIGAHLAVILWMALWMPVKKSAKKPLQVRTMVVQTTPVPKKETVVAKHTPALTPLKKPSPTPVVKKTAVKKTAPTVPTSLVRQLEESIAKIEQKSHKEIPKKLLQAPSQIPTLKIDEGSDFAEALVECLQTTLELPEVGTVKVELTLNQTGSFIRMHILQSESERNRKFLEGELKTLHYPAFSGNLKNEKEHAFVISFYSH